MFIYLENVKKAQTNVYFFKYVEDFIRLFLTSNFNHNGFTVNEIDKNW